MWQKEKLLVLSNFFFCHYDVKKPSAAEASESVYMRERVNASAYREDSGEPVRPHSPIRVFTVRMFTCDLVLDASSDKYLQPTSSSSYGVVYPLLSA